MPSFEINKLQAVSPVRSLSDTDRAATAADSGKSAGMDSSAVAQDSPSVEIAVGPTVDTASAPVDRDRVAEIREALRDGSYPLVPTEIADAMIAAQLNFGTNEQ